MASNAKPETIPGAVRMLNLSLMEEASNPNSMFMFEHHINLAAYEQHKENFQNEFLKNTIEQQQVWSEAPPPFVLDERSALKGMMQDKSE